jgi:hypothetical protein
MKRGCLVSSLSSLELEEEEGEEEKVSVPLFFGWPFGLL